MKNNRCLLLEKYWGEWRSGLRHCIHDPKVPDSVHTVYLTWLREHIKRLPVTFGSNLQQKNDQHWAREVVSLLVTQSWSWGSKQMLRNKYYLFCNVFWNVTS